MQQYGQITIANFKLNLNFETQLSKKGRPMRLSGIALQRQKPAVWINKQLMHGTIYTFRYLDNDEFISFEFDPYDNFIGIV